MTFDASNRKEIRRAEKAAAIADRQRAGVIQGLMQTSAGRAYIWDELAACHIFSTSFSLEALQMAFAEGERNAGLRLMDSIMESAPEEFLMMWREKRDRERAKQQPRGEDTRGDADSTEFDDPGDNFDINDPFAYRAT